MMEQVFKRKPVKRKLVGGKTDVEIPPLKMLASFSDHSYFLSHNTSGQFRLLTLCGKLTNAIIPGTGRVC